ncbi:MAG: sugar kinase [Promethearchaeota archaeon]
MRGTGPEVVCLGEMLVEMMRAEVGVPHDVPGIYKGPYPSGAPAIFIDSAARMAADLPKKTSTGFVGVVGDDAFGRMLVEKLRGDGVDVSRVRVDPEHATGVAFVQYDPDGSRKFIFSAGAAGMTRPEDLDAKFFRNVKSLHVMGSALAISESSREACYEAIRLTRQANPRAMVSFDPNLRPEMAPLDQIARMCEPVLNEANVILPSGEEAALIAGVSDELEACRKLLEGPAEMVVLKRGEAGCVLVTPDGERAVEGFKVEEVDPTGAGDSFGGAFIVGLLQGWPPEKAATFANAVGALKVTSFGPMPDHWLKDVLLLVDQQRPGAI